MISGYHLIGYREIRNEMGLFPAINPATGEQIGDLLFPEADPAIVDQAVQAAASASAAYRNLLPARRAAFLEAIADQIMALGPELLARCMAETALPEARLIGERARTCGQLRLFAEVVREGSWVDARIDPALPDRQPLPRPDIRSMLIPLGPVAVFGASNFPLAFSVAGGDTASALAAGCPVVVKAHPAHPGTSELVGRAIVQAARQTDMPEGVFSLVQGRTFEPGMALVQHPLVKAVGFTGSFRGGKALFDAAARRPEPIPVYAEMGSSNPVFFLPGALKANAAGLAAAMATSVTLGVGQFCTNPGIFVTLKSTESEEFVQETARQLERSAGGTMLTESIQKAYQEGIGHLEQMGALRKAASPRPDTASGAGAVLLQAEVEQALQHPALTEEVFGPSTLALTARDSTELVAFARSLSGHLTATIQGTEQDLAEHAELVEVLKEKVGRLIFNGFPTGVEVCDAMVHGGPFPATTQPGSTSVGTAAIRRFARPVCFQGFPDGQLPAALQQGNPLGIWRMVNGSLQKD